VRGERKAEHGKGMANVGKRHRLQGERLGLFG
jgi:hypothetical protein